MQINDLGLTEYRNYRKRSFNFVPGLNIIIGNNGAGKTNILESLIVLSNTKSFRTKDDSDLIRKGQEYLKIEANTSKGKYKVVINKNSKSLFINNLLIKKTSDYIGKINVILFKPGDLELFDNSPKERRKLLDVELGKVSKQYLKSLLIYSVLLKDKNHLLKEIEIDNTLLDLIDESMVPQIQNIIKEREKFFKEINKRITPIYQKLSGSSSLIEVNYKKSSEIDEVKEMIRKNREKDIYYHFAKTGPHHEDFTFMMDGYDLSSIASQGQKRMVLIAFKLALVEYIKNEINDTPIVLLDDIFSELDKNNQKRMVDMIPEDIQVIITNTDISQIKIDRNVHVIELKEEENV